MEWLFGKELCKLLNDEIVKNFIRISLLFSFWFIGIGNLSAQDREDITRMFREQEMKSWGDFIQNEREHKGDQNIDVRFYHLACNACRGKTLKQLSTNCLYLLKVVPFNIRSPP